MMGLPTYFTRTQKIGLVSFTLIVVGLLTSPAAALDPMGPPVAGLSQGQIKIGVDYSDSKMDLKLTEGTWIELLDGVPLDAGEAVPFTLKDFKAYRTYANIGFGASDNLEAFLRVGGTQGRFGDSIWEDGEDFDGSTDFAVGGGLKATFYEDGALRIGGLIQGSWAEYNGTLCAPHWFAADRVEIDLTQVQAAVGASYSWAERFSIYGGPFLHFVSGNLDDTIHEVDTATGGLLTSHYSWDIEEDSVFGAYAGAQLELTDNCAFNIEYQRTAAADAVALGLMWRN
jgi:opacity protein-like surface antigen